MKGMIMKKLIAGNWKMNGNETGAIDLAQDITSGLSSDPSLNQYCDFLVCPPFIHLAAVREILKSGQSIMLGAQDCTSHENGAYTGDISANMLKDFGCAQVILGHSERRTFHRESSELVAEKAAMAHQYGLTAIICVGEDEHEREKKQHEKVVAEQLEKSLPASATSKNTVIAYEPVWAIGSGKTASPLDIEEMHRFIRDELQEKLENSEGLRILYGGSVKPGNAREIFAIDNVHGALIGGASLKANDYLAIAQAAVPEEFLKQVNM